MTLGCIGYGSLIWSPRDLAKHLQHGDRWLGDGPALPVEFARESDRRRITLVIVPGHPESTTYWTPYNHANIDEAREQLAGRECCGTEHIGLLTASGRTESALTPALLDVLKTWMESKNLSGLVWTELPFGFKANPGHLPTVEDVCAYLEGLIKRNEHANAEEYIRKAPLQIDTPYRKIIEQRFGWPPL
ncbi:conserved hypothetical protein [Nitrospina gracilis 3/211]|uniref:Uncharacterized protein n=1 Tax=Nitrospina gracilis (strain 3/211) TaxID=1266370 RepID=M1YL50_NITG3|nr:MULTISPECIES: hypothetical protein [Nitrospina]MCF8724046.1 hypothetical protein [Nitrospina sp. Nb-3]CCQ91176.1 conserved hypothetical protein [Nitrospina gracilis 3/211]